jgi:hypothetical protein
MAKVGMQRERKKQSNERAFKAKPLRFILLLLLLRICVVGEL